jgi:hypothetical protein
VAVEYDQSIDGARLTPSTFTVEGRTVTRVYANAAPDVAEQGQPGRYAIIELSPSDPGAVLLARNGRELARKPAQASVVQARGGPRRLRQGSIPPTGPVATTATRNLIVDDFKAQEFVDPRPAIGCATTCSSRPTTRPRPIRWCCSCTTPERPAPSPTPPWSRDWARWSGPARRAGQARGLRAGPAVRRRWSTTHPRPPASRHHRAPRRADRAPSIRIDRDRLYATGQSMGAMMSIALNIKYPACSPPR